MLQPTQLLMLLLFQKQLLPTLLPTQLQQLPTLQPPCRSCWEQLPQQHMALVCLPRCSQWWLG